MARNAVVNIVVRARDLTGRVFGRVTRGIKGFTASIFTMRTAALGLSAVLVSKVVGALFQLGSAAEETRSKFLTVFGESAAEVEKFNETFGRLAGLSKEQAESLTSTTGAIVQGFGFAQDASADFAQQIVTLGADLASFNNLQGGAAEGAEILNTSLAGEFERLKRLGIVLRANEVDQRALILSGKSSAKQLTEQDRVMARFQLITEKAGVAVGDLTRTQDSLANVARRVTGQITDLRQSIGVIFTDALRLSGGFSDVTSVLGKMQDFFKRNRVELVAWTIAAINGAKLVASAFKTGFSVLFNYGQIVMNVFGGIGRAIAALWQRRFGDLDDIVRDTKNSIAGNLGDIAVSAEATGEKITDLLDSIRRAKAEAFGIDTGLAGELAAAAPTTPPRREDGAGGEDTEIARAKALKERNDLLDAAVEKAGFLNQKFELGLITAKEWKASMADTVMLLQDFMSAGDLTDEQLIAIAQALKEINAQASQLVEIDRLAGLSGLEKIGQSLVDTYEAGNRLDEVIGNVASNLLSGFGGAVEEAFGAFVSGSKSAGQAFTGAMLGAIASVARAQGQLFLAEALAALGRGLLGNPAAFAAAGKFTAAAAAMFALAGALGGFARGGGGGGGGGGTADTGDQQARRLESERGKVTVFFESGWINLNDPRQRQQMQELMEELSADRDVAVNIGGGR